MLNQGCFAVHTFGGSYDFSAEHFSDTLMAEADAQYGDLALPISNNIIAVASLGGCAGTGRDDKVTWLEGGQVRRSNLVIAENFYPFNLFDNRDGLDKIVGERVVVVDDDDSFHGVIIAGLAPDNNLIYLSVIYHPGQTC